jgi:hypothetical protein
MKKLVHVGKKRWTEFQTLQRGIGGIQPFLQNPVVELEPGKLAVEKTLFSHSCENRLDAEHVLEHISLFLQG